MTEQIWQHKTALELGAAIDNGVLDPRDLTELFLERIAHHDRDHAIYITVAADRARAEAVAASDRAKRGLRRSPLDGVPLSWKDLYDTAGIETTGGSNLLRGRVPERDCPLIERASRAGLILLGKTNLSEFAFSGLGINPSFGTPANAFSSNEPLAPGGSSSGAAVSVARGLAAAAMGSDTGGSVRIPAAWNGLVGLKITHGALPMDGVIPLSPHLDTAGPLTRDVADAAALWAILAREKPVAPGPLRPERLSLLMPETLVWDGLDAAVEAMARQAIDKLRQAGVQIHSKGVPEFDDATRLIDRGPYMPAADGYALWGRQIEAAPDQVFHQIVERFRMGAQRSAPDYAEILLARAGLQKSYLARSAAYDAVLMPATPNMPPPIAVLEADENAYIQANLAALRNTRLANYLGLSAITLPCGRTPEGLPAGLMLFAPPQGERRLLLLAQSLEVLFNA